MYVGHLAAALALKARVPKAPTAALLIGVGLLDLLFPLFVLAGVERVSPTPGQAPGMSLDFIDWSHSLAMSLVWSVLFALLFRKHERGVQLACAAAVFSHFLLDFPMHPLDLALWPHGAPHVGLGLWRTWPVGWWVFEAAFVLAGALYYVTAARRAGDARTFGGRPVAAAVFLFVLHAVNSPWGIGNG